MKLLNEILGTKYPIIQGGMANIATGEFAAACSNAGALGIIGAGGMDADTLRQNIRRCKQLTDKPFGVNIMLMHPQACLLYTSPHCAPNKSVLAGRCPRVGCRPVLGMEFCIPARVVLE